MKRRYDNPSDRDSRSLLSLIYPILFLLVPVFGACSDLDSPDPDGGNEENNQSEYSDKLYFAVNLEEPGGYFSRATNYGDNYEADFEDGIQNYESKVDNIKILFFEYENDSDSWSLWRMLKADNLNSYTGADKPGMSENTAWKKTIVLELDNDLQLNVPAKLRYVAIVNYYDHKDGTVDHKIDWESVTTLDEVYDLQWDLYQCATDKGFLMTTAAHYQEGSDTQNIYYNSYDSSSSSPLFYNSSALAERNPATIYVERLAAKVNFKIQKNAIHPVEVIHGTDIYSLTFIPKYWALSATESNEYLAKHQPESTAYATTTGYPSDFFKWLNFDYRRSFWAESVSFESQATYPAQPNSSGNMTLNYPKFKEITNPLTKSSEGEYTGSLYTLEHTFKASEFSRSGFNPYAVPTSIVAYGSYSAEKTGTDLRPAPESSDETGSSLDFLDFSAGGFYLREIDMERIPDDNVLTHRLYVKDNTNDELFDALLQEQYVIWIAKKDENGQSVCDHPVKAEDGLDIFELVNTYRRYDTANNAWMQNLNNEFSLQLKSDWQTKATQKGVTLLYAEYDSDNKTGKFETLNNDLSSTANNLLQQQLGSCQYYDKGYAFFFAPIPHYSGKEDPFKDGDGYNYKGIFRYNNTGTINHKTGDFGVVRNHIYDFTISGISGLGFGKTDDEDIPLPEIRPDNLQYYFDIRLEILPWNVFKYTFDI